MAQNSMTRDRWPAGAFFARLTILCGEIITGLAVVAVVFGLIAGLAGQEWTAALAALTSAAGLFTLGCVIYCVGHNIVVLHTIEENTRETARLLYEQTRHEQP